MDDIKFKDDLKDLATRCIGIQNMIRNAKYVYADQKLTGLVQKIEYMIALLNKNESNKDTTV